MNNLKIFGEPIIDKNAIQQIKNCLLEDSIGVLTPDAHVGKQNPVGGAVAYKNHLSWSGVGPDLCCGNKAVKTDIMAASIKGDISRIMDEVFNRVSFGVGRKNNEKIDHPVFDSIRYAFFKPQQSLLRLAMDQLGTVGSGNHFVDLFEGSDGFVWIGVHFGSRGFGFKTASGFLAMHQGLSFEDHGKEGDNMSPPVLFEADSAIGQDYWLALQLAGEYAYAGRDVVVSKVLEILGSPKVTKTIHNHHNCIWRENHFGETWWVVRKGCTPAFPDQEGFIGANMFDNSVIVSGVDSEDSRNALYSTVHGAGRVLSRTQAAGKKKWIKDESGRKVPKIVSKGLVDFDEVKGRMSGAGIELRGSGADEAPECYKKLNEVLSYMKNNVKILDSLRPIGVAMAGDTFDPYKD